MLIFFFFATFSFSTKSISITPQNLDEVTNNSKNWPVFIKFWSPYCPHCQDFEPTWNKFCKESNDECIIADVNCITQSNICEIFKIEKFPTIKWIHPSQNIEIDYFNERTLENLQSFVKLHLYSHFITLNNNNEYEISNQKNQRNIYIFEYKTKNDVIFNNVFDISKEFGKINVPVIAIPSSSNNLTFHEDDDIEKFNGNDFSKDELRPFFYKHIFSFFNEMKPEYISQLHTFNKPIIIYFLFNSPETKPLLRHSLNQLKSKYHFFYSDYNQTDSSLRDLFDPFSKTEPFLVFIDPKTKKYISTKAHLTKKSLLSWINEKVENDSEKEKWSIMFPSRFTVAKNDLDSLLNVKNKNNKIQVNRNDTLKFSSVVYIALFTSFLALLLSLYLIQCKMERSPGQPIINV